ncbi:hypothetical protein PSTT_01951 [Puccinia striiformis]|uniref:Thioredoxin domain-containing protein n=2 Tax=Puccinia striiformis TaxID=27350 RepID=A0A0L0VB48_9BASI|nr:hypothetical protein PSTG_10214 [Puccinia striiformis f. sp. tritici PST-78]POW15725.1 hypothetical protein PSTT_01951 [Puccinia striiformis]
MERFVAQIEAESLPNVAESSEVSSVPCFVILRGHQLLSHSIGAELPQLKAYVRKFVKARQNKQNNGKYEVLSETNQKPQPPSSVLNVNKLQASTGSNEDETEEQLFARCKSIMEQSNVVVFMKQTVGILQDLNIEFTTFDILTDDQLPIKPYPLVNRFCYG